MSIFDKLQRVPVEDEFGDITYEDIKKLHSGILMISCVQGERFSKV